MRKLFLSFFVLLLFVCCGDDDKYDYPITGSIECPIKSGNIMADIAPRWVGDCGTKITNGMKRCPRCKTSVVYIKALNYEIHQGIVNGENTEKIRSRLRSIDVDR